jgi:uncharacterized membrane protein (UPF0127 family)
VKRLFALAVILVVAACSSRDQPVTQVTTPPDTLVTTTSVTFPGGTIAAKIAATDSARSAGLMNVSTLGANAGMLFVFATDHTPANCAFWMQNTPLPLSIAFIDASMKVINVDEMAAETTAFHEPTSACRYVVEANQGWFAAHGVSAGTVVTFALPAGTVVDP